MIVTIDGPAGAGKSTVAKLIAAKLGYIYLDTGALYRAVAWKALVTGTDTTSPAAMERLCERIRLNILHTQDGGMAVEVDGLLLNAQIRTPEVTRAAAQVAVLPQVLRATERHLWHRRRRPGPGHEGIPERAGQILF